MFQRAELILVFQYTSCYSENVKRTAWETFLLYEICVLFVNGCSLALPAVSENVRQEMSEDLDETKSSLQGQEGKQEIALTTEKASSKEM